MNTFPEGTRIGIKQPYLKLSFSGTLYLRNDNPENIIFLPNVNTPLSAEATEVKNKALVKLKNDFLRE